MDNDKQSTTAPGSEESTEQLQHDQAGSPALDDPAIDENDVTNLPGTGGPDDEGDVDVDPADLNL